VRPTTESFSDVPSRGARRVPNLITQIEITVKGGLRRKSEDLPLKVAGQLPADELRKVE
jgi:hypothetical protein